MTFRAVIAVLALLGAIVPAKASVVPVFTVGSDTIQAGQQTTLDLILNLTADPGYSNANFTGGSVTLFSGTGLSQSFGISPGGASQHFNWSFTYPSDGIFDPGFSFSATYSEQYSVFGQTGSTWVTSGFYLPYPCGPTLCFFWKDTSHYEPTFGYRDVTVLRAQSGSGTDLLTVNALPEQLPLATPLPAALPLFATVLAGSVLIAWRRQRRRTALPAPPRPH